MIYSVRHKIKKHPFFPNSVRPLFFMCVGMVTAMDDAIGAVMAAFRKHKFMGNLIVVFTTDVSCMNALCSTTTSLSLLHVLFCG